MNNHKSACFVLLIFIAGMLYGVSQLRNSTASARTTSESARSEAESAEQQSQLAEIQMKSLESKTADLRRIYSEWEPDFVSYGTQHEAERRILELIREGDILPISRQFDQREVDKNERISEVLVGDLVFEDDYVKTLNWLGKLEQTIPACRITKCVLTRGDRGNNVNMELQIQIPLLKS